MTPERNHGDGRHWLYRPRTLSRLFRGLVLVCAALGLADLVYARHGVFSFEELPAGYGVYGFVCFVGIIFAGRGLRKLIMRDEDYYDR
ncbi:MAG: hypothetical protein ACE5GS_03270 [Kiloniellaceae bacterium]